MDSVSMHKRKIIRGISKSFSLVSEQQYDEIGAFWDIMSEKFGMENICGIGYEWKGTTLKYAIGLKDGDIKGWDVCIEFPEGNWEEVTGKTSELPSIYAQIYRDGPLDYEIETFNEDGICKIEYFRS